MGEHVDVLAALKNVAAADNKKDRRRVSDLDLFRFAACEIERLRLDRKSVV